MRKWSLLARISGLRVAATVVLVFLLVTLGILVTFAGGGLFGDVDDSERAFPR